MLCTIILINMTPLEDPLIFHTSKQIINQSVTQTMSGLMHLNHSFIVSIFYTSNKMWLITPPPLPQTSQSQALVKHKLICSRGIIRMHMVHHMKQISTIYKLISKLHSRLIGVMMNTGKFLNRNGQSTSKVQIKREEF